jgi:tRNA dimethylallyltransferase
VAPLLALVGPTASGKTEAGIEVAEALGTEILSIDSMVVYRGMDVGTAKPTPEQRARVTHHLLDLVEPSEPFSVAAFQAAAPPPAGAVPPRRGRPPLLVGGSGLYYRAVVDDLELPATQPAVREELEREAALVGARPMHRRLADVDPDAAAKIEPDNVRRTVRALEVAAITGRAFSTFAVEWDRYPPERVRVAGVRLPAPLLVERIERRVRAMLDAGWLDEVRGLVDRGLGGWLTATQAIGYVELRRHLDGELGIEEAIASILRRTRAFARRQLAWFRRDPRIRWFDVGAGGAVEAVPGIVGHLGGG